MHRASFLLRRARLEAGLTQAQLAQRAGTTQSVVARIEAPGANPRVESLEALLGAMHRGIELSDAPRLPPVDEGQIRDRLTLTPAQRLASFEASHRNLNDLVRRARRVPR